MSRKLLSPKQCPHCGDVTPWFTGKVCHNCYRKYKWVPKKKICPRCKRLKVMKARGHCGGCYNTVFMLQYQKDMNYRKYHNISPQLYKKITKSCIVCNFNKFVELHHIDCNRQNNSEDNMVGLCPNHHKMLHTIEYGGWLKELIERLVTLRRCQRTLSFTRTTENQANNPITLPILIKT